MLKDFTKRELENVVIFPPVSVGVSDSFSLMYPYINYMLYNLEQPSSESRAGNVKEILDWKTVIRNPYKRCVGGYERDINIFFLLAEAMWIFYGRKDVEFLTLFNAKMSDFSDDGKVFHAPYGFRLRHWGVRSEDKYKIENLHAADGADQIEYAIRMFSADKNTRQVALSIWNPDLDLGIKSKDIPCNDFVMLKIREGKLITTIANRSNDLHWGLPTNVFQFSFVTELISLCLGVELGTQTHNSQSLHIYDWNPISKTMSDNFEANFEVKNIYDYSKEMKIDFDFSNEVPVNRLREIDAVLNLIMSNLKNVSDGVKVNQEMEVLIAECSNYLFYSYLLCKIYLEYKKALSEAVDDKVKEMLKISSIAKIEENIPHHDTWDVAILAKNFFASRLKSYEHKFLGKL